MPGLSKNDRLDRLHALCINQRAEINHLHLIIADALTCLQDDGHYLARIQKARQVMGQAEQFKTPERSPHEHE